MREQTDTSVNGYGGKGSLETARLSLQPKATAGCRHCRVKCYTAFILTTESFVSGQSFSVTMLEDYLTVENGGGFRAVKCRYEGKGDTVQQDPEEGRKTAAVRIIKLS